MAIYSYDFESDVQGFKRSVNMDVSHSNYNEPPLTDFDVSVIPASSTSAGLNRRTGDCPSVGIGADSAADGSYYLYYETSSSSSSRRTYLLLPDTYNVENELGLKVSFKLLKRGGVAPETQFQYLPDGADTTTGWIDIELHNVQLQDRYDTPVWTDYSFNLKTDHSVTVGTAIRLRIRLTISPTGDAWMNDQCFDSFVIDEQGEEIDLQFEPSCQLDGIVFQPHLIHDGDISLTLYGTGQIDWGDGSALESFDDETLIHTYSFFNGYLKFYGNLGHFVHTSSTDGSVFSFNTSDISEGIIRIVCYGDNLITGDIASFPDSLTTIDIDGDNTLYGDIGDLKAGFNWLELAGNNALTGSIADLPIAMTGWISCRGFNTIYGDIGDMPIGITHILLAGYNRTTYQNRRTLSGFDVFYHRSDLGISSLTAEETDNIIIDLNTGGMNTGTIYLNYTGNKRTVDSDSAISSLTAAGVTVYVPSAGNYETINIDNSLTVNLSTSCDLKGSSSPVVVQISGSTSFDFSADSTLYELAFFADIVADGYYDIYKIRGNGFIDWGDGTIEAYDNPTYAAGLNHTYSNFTGSLRFYGEFYEYDHNRATIALTYDFANLPRYMVRWADSEANSASTGDMLDLPRGLTSFRADGTSLTGDIANMPPNMVYCLLSSTVSLIYGEIDNLPSSMTYVFLRTSHVDGIKYNGSLPFTDLRLFGIQTTVNPLTTGEIDQLLIDTSVINWSSYLLLRLAYVNEKRSINSNDALAVLEGKGVTVEVNGLSILVIGDSDLGFTTSASITGEQTAPTQISGSTSLDFSINTAITGKGQLNAINGITFETLSALIGTGHVTGHTSLEFTGNVDLIAKGNIEINSQVDFSTSVDLQIGSNVQQIVCSTSLNYGSNGILIGNAFIIPQTTFTFSHALEVTVKASISGDSQFTFDELADIGGLVNILGEIELGFGQQLVLQGVAETIGDTTFIFSELLDLTEKLITSQIRGNSDIVFSLISELKGKAFINAIASLDFTTNLSFSPISFISGNANLSFSTESLIKGLYSLSGESLLQFSENIEFLSKKIFGADSALLFTTNADIYSIALQIYGSTNLSFTTSVYFANFVEEARCGFPLSYLDNKFKMSYRDYPGLEYQSEIKEYGMSYNDYPSLEYRNDEFKIKYKC